MTRSLTWIEFPLRAATEAALAVALPFARSNGMWVEATNDDHPIGRWALILIGGIDTAQAITDANGKVTTPAVKDNRFHALIRVSPAMVLRVAIALRLTKHPNAWFPKFAAGPT